MHARAVGPQECAAAATKADSAVAAAAAAPMTEAEAERLAEAEGLELLRASSKSGFRGVSPYGKHFTAVVCPKVNSCGQVGVYGKDRILIGTFRTAPEAALAYSRHLGRDWFASRCMSEVEAHRPAEAEGLKLVHSANATGYKAVTRIAGKGNHPMKPFTVGVKRMDYREGRNRSLGIVCQRARGSACLRAIPWA